MKSILNNHFLFNEVMSKHTFLIRKIYTVKTEDPYISEVEGAVWFSGGGVLCGFLAAVQRQHTVCKVMTKNGDRGQKNATNNIAH